MLPSCGFFRGIYCPYDKAKLCHRPYCHYKHAGTDNKGEKIAGHVEETEYLFHTNPSANPSRSVYAPVEADNVYNAAYVPTPVNKCGKPVGILKSNNFYEKPSSSTIPVYNPTPISKLKELSNSQTHFETRSYSPEYSYPAKRKKKIEEYDPTEVRCVPKKTVSFADQSGIACDSESVPAFSSDDEIDDTAGAPKFSDDDLDDDAVVSAPRNIEILPVPEKKIEEEEEEIEEKPIDEFSLVDKILVDCKKNKKLLTNFKKPVTVQKNSSKKPPVPKKVKISKTVASNDVYDCDLDSETPSAELPSNFDYLKAITALESVDESKTKLKNSETNKKSVHSKPETSSKESKDKTSNKSKHSSSIDAKSKESSSKESTKKKDKDSKHSSSKTEKSSSGNKEKKSESKSEKNKSSSHSSKTEKSGSHSKESKSDKTKLTSSSKTDKTSSSSKSEKSKSSSSKSHLTREEKLQDEKVSSSSIVKKNKHEQSLKPSSKSTDYGSKSKSKSSGKDDKTKDKSVKRKADDSGSELFSEKPSSKKKALSPTASGKPTIEVYNVSSDEGDYNDALSLSSDSEHDVDQECWKIYNESHPESSEHPQVSNEEDSSSAVKPPSIKDVTASEKKRKAHPAAADIRKSSSKSKKIDMKPRDPGQIMLDRFAQIRAAQLKAFESKSAEMNSSEQNELKNRNSNLAGRPLDKKRISVVPNHSLLAAIAEKNKLNKSGTSGFSPLPPTVSKTLKVTNRVAHVPDLAVKARPIIPADYGSKVPTVVRQKFLNAFIDEYLKFSSTEDEAYDNALEEEKKAYQRSSSKAIYVNVASNALNRLRHRVKSDVSSTTNPSVKTVSHETVLNGPQAQRTSFSIERKKSAAPTADLKGTALYEHLMTYALAEEQLKENGYPFPHPAELGKAIIQGIYANRIQYCNDPFKRTCSRCQKTYYVNVDGDYVRDEECEFHWGRLWKRRIAGTFESRYSCCQGDSESDGCCVGPGHVFEGSEAHAMKGYVNTLPKTPPPDHYYGIYALDCEMCYTTAGVELTRISVIDPDLKPVYETFVKPQNKVLDYNTRFSGITEESLKNVRTTIRDVQAVLLCMFNTRTILIGHSLESDFKALKLFHKTVVDTSVVFPHKLGLPFKRALRTITAEKINKIIQNDVGGHDSAEDAVACMELIRWKIREDLKGNR